MRKVTKIGDISSCLAYLALHPSYPGHTPMCRVHAMCLLVRISVICHRVSHIVKKRHPSHINMGKLSPDGEMKRFSPYHRPALTDSGRWLNQTGRFLPSKCRGLRVSTHLGGSNPNQRGATHAKFAAVVLNPLGNTQNGDRNALPH